ncbi:MAG: PQQ-binding-like beta-propeller repeat protein [Phycisphaera sp.]|nr:PQQ-binding-like beta-propeller repeat protein [Phycisphaera sp.]
MNRFYVVLVTGLIAVFGFGCQQQKVDPMTRLLIPQESARALEYGIRWQEHLGLENGAAIKNAEVLDDKVVTLESGNIVSVLDAATGDVRWRTKVAKDISNLHAPERTGKRLVVCSETRAHVYNIDSGNLENIFNLTFISSTAPLITQNMLINGSPNGIVWAQDLDYGLKRWDYSMQSAISTDPILTGPSLLVTSRRGDLAAFNPTSGVMLWRTSTWNRIAAQPFSTDLMIYVASEDQSLYAYERSTGRQRWRYFAEDPLTSSPTAIGDLVFVNVPGKGLVALDTINGNLRWNRADLDGYKPLHIRGEHLYLFGEHRILILSRTDGRTVSEIKTPKVDTAFIDNPKDGNLYLINSRSGQIMKLTPR